MYLSASYSWRSRRSRQPRSGLAWYGRLDPDPGAATLQYILRNYSTPQESMVDLMSEPRKAKPNLSSPSSLTVHSPRRYVGENNHD
jgi:hypothetical protein